MDLLVLFLGGILLSIVIAAVVAKIQVASKNSKSPSQVIEKIDYSTIDYKKLYLTKYKKLPQIYYIVTLGFISAVGLLDILVSSDLLSDAYEGLFSFLIGSEDYISGFLALIIWAAIAFCAAHLVQYLSAIALSQKVVVADALLDIQKTQNTCSAAPNIKASTSSQNIPVETALERIAKLKAQGILTEEEAAKMRADVLSRN